MNCKSIMKRICAAAIACVMTVSLASCGGKGDKTEQTNQNGEMPEYTYVAEYIDLGDEDVNLYDAKFYGDTMYYTSYSYDEEKGISSEKLHKYSLTEKKEISSFELNRHEMSDENRSRYVSEYEILENGGRVTLERLTDYSNDEYKSWYYLCLYDEADEMTKEVDLGEASGIDMSQNYVQSFVIDTEGKFYVQTDSFIMLFDSELNYAGKVDLSNNWINQMGIGRDGKVYASMYDDASRGYCLKEVDYNAKNFGQTYNNFPSGNGNGLIKGDESDFLVNDGIKMYGYDLATQERTEILTWLDVDIFGDYVQGITSMEDGNLVAAIRDWDTGENELAVLKKVKSSEVAQKTILTIGTFYPDQRTRAAVVAFNKSNNKYHISIKSYYDYNNRTENSYEDALTAMNNDILSSNCPDMFEVRQINVEKYAAKGVFEDLGEWLDKSSKIKRSDFFENILEGTTYDGCLVSIPKTFELNTVVGKTADVGEKRGWSIDDVIDFAGKHKDAELFEYFDKQTMLYYMLAYNQNAFVDYTTGKCSFDTDSFKKVLEFVSSFPDEYNWDADSDSLPKKLEDGRVLLDTTYISDLEEVQLPGAMYNAPVTFIGYPTMDGSVGCILSFDSGLAISAKSANKEGAWEFLEYYLSDDDNGRYSWGFPTRKAGFEKLVDEALNIEYLKDENGELILDEEGNPIPMGGHGGIGYGDWDYTYRDVTEEEVELVRQLITEAKPAMNTDDQIMSIISEEAAPYFDGKKSVDEVAGIIQSRIQLYINENQ